MTENAFEKTIVVDDILGFQGQIITLAVPDPSPPGARISFEIDPPGVVVHGKVTSIQKGRQGFVLSVRPASLSRDDRQRLHDKIGTAVSPSSFG